MQRQYSRHRAGACWVASRRLAGLVLWQLLARPLLLLAALLAITFATGAPATAAPAMSGSAAANNGFTAKPTANGPILAFTDADIVFAPGYTIPNDGWVRKTGRLFWQLDVSTATPGKVTTAWARFRFDRTAIGNDPIAIYTEDNRERLSIYVNGVDIYRNFVTPNDAILAWNHPYLVAVPSQFMKPGINEIVIRAESEIPFNISLGKPQIGPHVELARHYDWQNFWRVTGPRSANMAMLFLTFAVLLMWAGRKMDNELPVLALCGIFWSVRNHHFYGDAAVLPSWLYVDITAYSLYFAVFASLSFCVAFVGLKHRWRIVGILFGWAFLLSLVRALLHDWFDADLPVIVAMTLIIGWACWIIMFSERNSGHLERNGLAALLVISGIFSIHDYGRISAVNWWEGFGFFVQPFLGAVLFGAFLLSIGRRYLVALSTVETLNINLEARIETARHELEISEAERRDLIVASALERERERIMREVHDGVGSSLVTALAVAKRQNQSPNTIATLRKTLVDLKVAIDSLEPVEGDVVALLANLRHRLEPDLREAGITSIWMVEPCPTLAWLEPQAALHVLRIAQEAISNVLIHAHASKLEIGCKPESRDSVAGILISICDNGAGFEVSAPAVAGHGLSNMKSRAESLGGAVAYASSQNGPTRVTLWLPLEQIYASAAV